MSLGNLGGLNMDLLVGAFGAPAVSEAMDKLIAVGLPRALELNTTGFETSGHYDMDRLTRVRDLPMALSLRSETTNTSYAFRIPQDARITNKSVNVILVAIADGVLQPTQMTKHHLAPYNGPLGQQIKVMPGWQLV